MISESSYNRKLRRKGLVYLTPFLVKKTLALILPLVLLASACSEKVEQLHIITGSTMGTNYVIKYVAKVPTIKKKRIDSLLVAFNQSVSTYIPESTISRFNSSATSIPIQSDVHFSAVYQLAIKVHAETDGAFHPGVMPLVNLWGFGYTDKPEQLPDSALISNHVSLLQQFGSNTKHLESDTLFKPDSLFQLDFSAIAKGYGVDLLSDYLNSQGLENHLIEIGGELRASGTNNRNQLWSIAIEKPVEKSEIGEAVQLIASLDEMSMATSGNYRNFHLIDGMKVTHTINPATGYPQVSNLLSATVFHKSCALADAYATALMVMGFDKALHFVDQTEGTHALLIVSSDDGTLKILKSNGLDNAIQTRSLP